MLDEGFVFPLSFAQRRLWFVEQLEPGTGVYNLPVAYRLRGPLSLPALERSLNEIVRRHEALRTTFSVLQDEPVQVIAPVLKIKVQIVDFRDLSGPAREAEAAGFVSDESRRPFDLSKSPLLRASVLQLAKNEHILFLVLHHIISDGWSMNVLFRELAVCYEAFLQEKPCPLPDLPIQYADFAVWQREWLQGDTLQTQLSYWRKTLQHIPQLLELPTDRPRPPAQTYNGARQSTFVSKTISYALKGLCQREGVTLFMIMLAAFKTLLYRYTGQHDIVVGTPIAGRDNMELEGLIGFFVNTLVLRTDLSGNPTFTTLLRRVREVALGAYENQDSPFEKLVEELQPDRHLSRLPLFQVMFQFRNFFEEPVRLAGLHVEEFEFEFGLSKFDLALHVIEKPEGLSCLFRYNVDLFDSATISRMGEHFKALLEGIVKNAEQHISELPLLTTAEKRQLLNEQKTHPLRYLDNQSIHQLFEAQVERTPEAVAVIFEGQQLTYRELNAQANRLAHYLKKHGVSPETLVGICVERSLEMLIGVLGILKAGGAYVPLDPEYPKSRLNYILEETQIGVLLTKERLLENFSEFKGQALCLDRDCGLFEREQEENPDTILEPDNLAYVMYTSGSTGKPKGVLGYHRGVVNYLSYLRETYNLNGADTVLQIPSLSFDASVRDSIGPLTAGAKVVIVNDFDAKEPAALLAKIKERDVTCILSMVPTLLKGLVDSGRSRNLLYDSIRLILVSGEALTMSTCQKAKEVFGRRTWIVNQYGPTETTMTCSYHRVLEADNKRRIAPLGRSIPNARMYILDSYLNPVPIGIPGELHIRGVGLARGYLNSPDLTAERFIPDPFSTEPGARLYKTGDLARYMPDGNMDFLGRIDHQVKVHGFRIELGEIEAALSQHSLVRESMVAARNDSVGNQLLVAYVVSSGEVSLSSDELRTFLREKLPEYMVPSLFVFLDELPLTANRKVDRHALPDPDRARPGPSNLSIAPRTSVEAAVTEIWREFFKVDKIGVDDNFFELGGYSLQATQVISRLRDTFKVEMPLRRLFERPTVAGLARCIEEELGSERKQHSPALYFVSRYKEFPLSFAQQRLWFLEQLEPLSPVYNIPAAFRLTGPLHLVALEQSLNEIVRRHEVLRTSFAGVEGQPVQTIAPTLRLTLPVVDLGSVPETEREAEALRLATEEARRPFELAQAPLLRARVLRLDKEEHILLLTMHHIISDGWSLDVLFRELSTLYSAFSEGKPSPLAELPIQYVDFALWQRQWLQGEILDNQLSYWKQQLNGAPPLLELSSERPRPAVQTFRGAKQSLALPKVLTESLKALSRKEEVTLFMTLLAAFQTMLHRYTGQEDIVVGTPIANRNRREVEGLIGFFANTLALRTDLSGNPTFRELLGRVQEVALGAYAHQDLPFEKLVEELQPERDLSRNPLFQVMFALQQDLISGLEFSGLSSKPVKLDRGVARFDLTLTMIEGEEGLRAVLEYNSDLFDNASMTRMLGHWQTSLEGIVAEPDRQLSELPLLTERERQQLLVEWNDTGKDYAKDQCIHQLFESQVDRTPDATAVVFEDKQLTYRELNRRANQLAHHLRGLGVRPEVRVGICMERSLEMVIGLLGILKAGAAYVPLDPGYPKERLAFMLEDSQALVLLTEEKLLTETTRRTVICLDRDLQSITAESDENPKSGVDADNLAYLIYTSGSTGKPKGVQIAHRSLLNAFSSMQQQPGMNHQDALLAVTTLSFDIAALELFLPLTVGARVVIVSREVAADGVKLKKELSDSGATVMQATPATWRLLVEAGWSRGNHLRVQCGGESLPRELARQLMAMSLSLWNLYGPTETTIYSTVYPVESGEGSVPIGRPIGNTEIYLLDPQLSPVPVGIPAQLYIGGEGLARGYLNRPELTAEKFIPNPFSQRPGARLYKTGDLARYLPDGNIEFLGRLDNQVKIRGFRIEVGEIEAVLGQHLAVREAVVVAREDEPGDKRLVAYVMPHQQPLRADELRSFLKKKLPEYMVPSAFVLLDALPLTLNRKVDRRALPKPDQTRPNPKEIFVAPRTHTEKVLAGIWAEVLKLEKVGVHDNFFDLGGHSLLATQVISRLRNTFQVEMPVRRLFETPTVGGLARCIEKELDSGGEKYIPAPRSISRYKEFPLSFAQQRLWFLEQLDPLSPVYNIPAAFRLTGPLHLVALEQSLNEIVRRHEVLRTSFAGVEGQPVQTIAPTLRLTLPVVDLGSVPETEREAEALRLATEEARRPFELAQAPLLRARVLRLDKEEHILLLTMHHIVSDGWSLEILFRELSALYRAFSEGKSSPLAELPIQYADFAVWQREWLQGEVLEKQLSYWKQQLKGAPSLLQLPTDRPRPAVQGFHGARQSVVLSKTLSDALHALSLREGVSLYMTLLAAFTTLLYRYTGQDDIVVGSPIANRNRSEIEGLIGFFVNTLLLRSDLSGNPTFRELLAQVREACLGAYAHQDLPFEKLVEELEPERDLSRNPLFQVMFVLQQDLIPSLGLSGMTLRHLKLERGIARFDLTFSIIEAEEELRGVLVYNTDLFDDASMTRMLGHWQTSLEGIVADPDKRLSELSILTEVERHQLLVEWNSTRRDYSVGKCIHHLFEAQVGRTPEARAVIFQDQFLTYRELNRRANQLAHRLRALGVRPEVRVGICMERSLEMVIGLLGILKAGAAYVPLDPAYPEERLAFMLEDAQVSVLFTQKKLAEKLPWGELNNPISTVQNRKSKIQNRTVVCLDTDREIIARESEENPSTKTSPSNLAYVIYTSGSTGTPKGVLVSHRGLCGLAHEQARIFEVGPGSRVLQFSSLSFDASTFEIVMALATGATLCLGTPDSLLPGPALIRLLQDQAITIVTLPPSALAALPVEKLPALRTITVAGEACSPKVVESWAPDRRFFNLYGPTEATIWATMAECSPGGGTPPIGRPISNTQIYILDPHLKPVPVGLPGELYIGGEGLARGYLKRPELTAEKFIPNPFSQRPGARLYKTGDLARYRPDGNIEFLGRIDNQVKIRGFRIELGEIEAVLGQHPAAEQVIVVARKDQAGDQRLVAYVASKREPLPTAHELRNFLGQKLPSCMIPSSFVFLEALPLTPHGKVDRKALPAREQSQLALERGFTAPSNRSEEVLAGLWAEVLGLERVSVHDNFFELGGHSLKAMQLASRMSAAMNIDVSVKLLFEYPTISSLAAVMVDMTPAHQRPSEGQLKPVGRAIPDSPEPQSRQGDSIYIKIERRPLLSLFAAGKIDPVDAAAVGYLPDALAEQTGLTHAEIIHDWYEQLPTITNILETFWGRIAIIILPLFASELYRSRDGVVKALIEALEVTGKLGARTVSLTGLIPSATNYGQALGAAMAPREDLPKITTGHANTAATVVLAIDRILSEAARDLAQERVGFLGLGSIGVTTLRLMLRCLPHPKEILLCDVYDRRDLLAKIQEEIASDLGFHGLATVVTSKQSVPTEFYDATLIVGATNVPEVIDIGAVRPGTILVDDSAPHCFSVGRTVERFQKHADILFTEGGALQSPHPIHRLRYLPRFVEKKANPHYLKTVSEHNPFQITGCVLSGLLLSCSQKLAPTVGLADDSSCLRHYEMLCQLGFQAAELHCGDFVLPEESVHNFRQRFGGNEHRAL